jgi:dihydrofolate reductase
MPKISIILAASKNHCIGINNTLPWHLPADLKRFKALTMGHCMIMGRKTFESIGKALPGRTSIVITRNPQIAFDDPNVLVAHSFDEALKLCEGQDEVFVIGGAEIHRQAIAFADKIYLTEININVFGDAYIPELSPDLWQETERIKHFSDEKNKYNYDFVVYQKNSSKF